MKKSFTLFLAFIMLVTMLPVNVSATEQRSSYDDLIALASDVFPEYADVINGKGAVTANFTNIDGSEIVFQETRSVSESQSVTYVQRSDGSFYIINEYPNTFDLDVVESNPAGFTAGTRWTFSFEIAFVNSSDLGMYGVFYLDDVEITIYDSAYDRISNAGTAYVNDSNYCQYRVNSIQLAETASSHAELAYALTFIPYRNYGVLNSQCIVASFKISAGDNGYGIQLR